MGKLGSRWKTKRKIASTKSEKKWKKKNKTLSWKLRKNNGVRIVVKKQYFTAVGTLLTVITHVNKVTGRRTWQPVPRVKEVKNLRELDCPLVTPNVPAV